MMDATTPTTSNNDVEKLVTLLHMVDDEVSMLVHLLV
jgi:hypothetical protein